jgi:DNA repair exonuclease SbcCD ATPase subunit
MGETEQEQHDALIRVMASATEAMKAAEEHIEKQKLKLSAIHQLALDLPCSCWINRPKCPVCQLVELSAND